MEETVCTYYINNRCSRINCKYQHIPMKELLLNNENNKSLLPCSFLYHETGCSMIIPSKCSKTNNILFCSCELDKKRNHFYNPKYVCESYFYETSLLTQNDSKDIKYSITNDEYHFYKCSWNCGRLHIPWKNFVKNMFYSKLDKDKSLCIKFLVGIYKNIIDRDMICEQYNFNKIIYEHNRLMKIYKSRYWSKCIKCGLRPYQPKVNNIRFICYKALSHKKILCIDLILIVIQFLYEEHKIKKNGSYDCMFIENIDNSNGIEIKTLSKINIYNDDRVISHSPKYIIYKYPDKIESLSGPSLDTYSLDVKKNIYKNLLSK